MVAVVVVGHRCLPRRPKFVRQVVAFVALGIEKARTFDVHLQTLALDEDAAPHGAPLVLHDEGDLHGHDEVLLHDGHDEDDAVLRHDAVHLHGGHDEGDHHHRDVGYHGGDDVGGGDDDRHGWPVWPLGVLVEPLRLRQPLLQSHQTWSPTQKVLVWQDDGHSPIETFQS